MIPSEFENVTVIEKCPVCEMTASARCVVAREMQLGTREQFVYVECSACESVHIQSVPLDLGRHYPANYYSLAKVPTETVGQRWLRRLMSGWLISSKDPLARLIAHKLRYRRFAFFEWARLTNARFSSKILDVGCGSGALLRRMKRFGFEDLEGVDPFTENVINEDGLRIRRCELSEVDQKYDVVIMNHVLEHLRDPVAALTMAKDRLSAKGHLLVRIPLAGSYAHRTYGASWVNLDAPRHLVIPSLRGFHLLAERAGLRVKHEGFDGEEASFLLSESYQQDLPMARASRPGRSTRIRYRKLAHQLNATRQGDMGVFVLQPRL